MLNSSPRLSLSVLKCASAGMATFDALSYTCHTSSDHDIPLFVTYHVNAHTIYAHHSLLRVRFHVLNLAAQNKSRVKPVLQARTLPRLDQLLEADQELESTRKDQNFSCCFGKLNCASSSIGHEDASGIVGGSGKYIVSRYIIDTVLSATAPRIQ